MTNPPLGVYACMRVCLCVCVKHVSTTHPLPAVLISHCITYKVFYTHHSYLSTCSVFFGFPQPCQNCRLPFQTWKLGPLEHKSYILATARPECQIWSKPRPDRSDLAFTVSPGKSSEIGLPLHTRPMTVFGHDQWTAGINTSGLH